MVCPQCFKIYNYEDCVLQVGSHHQSLKCQYVEFPNHPQRSRREKCSTILLKQVRNGRKSKLVPRKTYIYQSVLQTLTNFVQDHTSYRTAIHGNIGQFPLMVLCQTYMMVYMVWKNLGEIDGNPYLSLPNNLYLALNVDWFNPYKHTPYSAGAIYLSILNLPRAKRFKPHNTILVGMIPGPSEPANLNPFLEPLVSDLKRLYQGIYVNSSTGRVKIRAILMCIACDLPAIRKVCGFSNFNALKRLFKVLENLPNCKFWNKTRLFRF